VIDYLVDRFNKEGVRVLEIGSRNVTGAILRSKFSKGTDIGFDFYPGENVDIVGDAHKLTTYFKDQEKFDLIFSSAVFEHLYMPWVAAVEIQRMLKVGGYVFVETHFSFSSHERPWNFFQFSDVGLRSLFSSALGFDLIEKRMCNPIHGFFSHKANKDLRNRRVSELYCHSEILCRKLHRRRKVIFNGDFVFAIADDWSHPPLHSWADSSRCDHPGLCVPSLFRVPSTPRPLTILAVRSGTVVNWISSS
jgi:hypothetical protein